MSSRHSLLVAATFFFLALLTINPVSAASEEKLLYSFNDTGGSIPYSTVIMDAAGNLYGTLYWGGSVPGCGRVGCGTVFELMPQADGKWMDKVLYQFRHNGFDGRQPWAGLTMDGAGNLYGTTIDGGPISCFDRLGCGTVFELSPQTGGGWIKHQLHSFGKAEDGTAPIGGLISDSAGNIYGTTTGGGKYGSGTVFQLRPLGDGKWDEKVLHSFSEEDGSVPYAGLIFDAAGSLYGTTSRGGNSNNGSVFQLTRGTDDEWALRVLHTFDGTDGANPQAALIFDNAGNLYGTTEFGGSEGSGTVFELVAGANGKWTEQVLHSFKNSKSVDGINPVASLIFDAAGNLYSTTEVGGSDGVGTVFELIPGANGRWTEKLLHSFIGTFEKDGNNPTSGLVFDSAGNLYGTTSAGGAHGAGAVFEIMP